MAAELTPRQAYDLYSHVNIITTTLEGNTPPIPEEDAAGIQWMMIGFMGVNGEVVPERRSVPPEDGSKRIAVWERVA